MVPRMPRSHLTHALIIQKTQIENTTNKLKHKRPRLFNILPPNRFPQAGTCGTIAVKSHRLTNFYLYFL